MNWNCNCIGPQNGQKYCPCNLIEQPEEKSLIDILSELSETSQIFEDVEKQYGEDCDQFWKNLSEEDRLKAFFSVCKRINQGDIVDERSYRGVLYTAFGFGPEAYSIGMWCGYMSIHNLIFEGLSKIRDRSMV